MSQGTTFRVLAFDVKNSLSKDEIMRLAIDDRMRGFGWGSVKTEEDAKKDIEKNGIAPFLPILLEQTEEDKQSYQHRQKEDPYPLWVDTKTGFVGQEILDCDFTSDFDKLYEHFNLQPEGPNECMEISKDQVRDMVRVLDYIKLGKYDKDIEEAFFSDSEFFRVFEDQFFNFSMRFRRIRKDTRPVVKVIIKDERTDVEQEREEDESEYEDEISESKRDEAATIDYLRSVLSAYLMLSQDSYYYTKEKRINVKLGYWKWI